MCSFSLCIYVRWDQAADSFYVRVDLCLLQLLQQPQRAINHLFYREVVGVCVSFREGSFALGKSNLKT